MIWHIKVSLSLSLWTSLRCLISPHFTSLSISMYLCMYVQVLTRALCQHACWRMSAPCTCCADTQNAEPYSRYNSHRTVPYNTLCSALMYVVRELVTCGELVTQSVSQSVSQSMTWERVSEWVSMSDSQSVRMSCSLWVCQRSVSESVKVYAHWWMR